MKKSTFFLLLLVGIIVSVVSVQAQIIQTAGGYSRVAPLDTYYSQQVFYNPAFAGELSQPKFSLSSRFLSYGNTKPSTYTLTWQGPFEALRGGLGLTAQYHSFNETFTNSTGVLTDAEKRMASINVLYSYIFQVGDKGDLKLGLSAGLIHFKNNYIYTPSTQQGQTPVSTLNVPLVKPSFDVGFLYSTPGFYAGLALKYMNQPSFEFFQGTGASGNTFNPNAYITLGGDIPLVGERIALNPSVLFNSLGNARSGGGFNANRPYVDLTLRCSYNKLAYVGASYKFFDSAPTSSASSSSNSDYWLALLVGGRIGGIYEVSGAYNLSKKQASKLEISLAIFFNEYEEE